MEAQKIFNECFVPIIPIFGKVSLDFVANTYFQSKVINSSYGSFNHCKSRVEMHSDQKPLVRDQE